MIGFTMYKLMQGAAIKYRQRIAPTVTASSSSPCSHGTSLMPLCLLRMFRVLVGIDLSPSAIAMIDSAYLGLLGVYGGFPRSVKSLLFTGLTYGLPTILKLLGKEDSLGVIEHFPKYASRLGSLYSLVSTLAILLVVLAFIPACYKLMQSDAVQDAVQSVVDSGKQSGGRQGGVGVRSGKGVGGDGGSGGYDAVEQDDGAEADDDDDDEEEEDEPAPVKQRPQTRPNKQGKVRQ